MTEHPYVLFNKSPEQLRHLGAWGGRTFARNQRVRRALAAPYPSPRRNRRYGGKLQQEAIRVLDALFPWLHGAEIQNRTQSMLTIGS